MVIEILNEPVSEVATEPVQDEQIVNVVDTEQGEEGVVTESAVDTEQNEDEIVAEDVADVDLTDDEVVVEDVVDVELTEDETVELPSEE